MGEWKDNPFNGKIERGSGGAGHRANWSGPAQVTGTGAIGMFGPAERKWESEKNERLHTPYEGAGSYGVAHMRPCGEDGKPLTADQAKLFRIQHNGRSFPVGKDGTLRYLDCKAFEGAIKDGLEQENYLSKLTAYILGGDELCKKVFGPDFLKHCAADTSGKAQDCNGLLIPPALAKEDCTPSVLRLYDPSQGEFLRGSAKFRAIVSTIPVIPLGDLPSWNMGIEGAGEKNDSEINPDAVPPVVPEA